ncbi:hypothetical protein HKX48_002124, partial [Thoreauomyces humboldtii]
RVQTPITTPQHEEPPIASIIPKSSHPAITKLELTTTTVTLETHIIIIIIIVDLVVPIPITEMNSSLVLLMHHSRVQTTGQDTAMYLPSVAVVFMELIKLAACLVVLAWEEKGDVEKVVKMLVDAVWSRDTLRFIVPSGIYAMQNNLLYTALSNLDATTFQVTYQLKLLTTAVFSVVLLGRGLSRAKWAALLILVVGVVIVQMQAGSAASSPPPSTRPSSVSGGISVATTGRFSRSPSFPSSSSSSNDLVSPNPRYPTTHPVLRTSTIPDFSRPPTSPSPSAAGRQRDPTTHRSRRPQRNSNDDGNNRHHRNYLLGILAVVLSSISSGFAGCYFELLLKEPSSSSSSSPSSSSSQTTRLMEEEEEESTASTSTSPSPSTSMWLRNVQLGVWSLLISLLVVLVRDVHIVRSQGLTSGFDLLAWSVVVNQAVGGLVVAVVVKHADSVRKGFATSLSIVVSSVVGAVVFGVVPGAGFVVGAGMVVAAVAVYSVA